MFLAIVLTLLELMTLHNEKSQRANTVTIA